MLDKTKLQPLKGFRDFLPESAAKRQWLISKIRTVFERWGYEPMETPTLESLEVFEGQIGEDEKLFYKFTDNGGRNVALRYDQTVPTCRAIAANQNDIVFPFKRYQIQSSFRAENTQKGRYREFLQCDGDIFGSKSAYADAEVIALTLDIYKEIGFTNPKVLINDRSLFRGFPYEAIVAIDKLEKIGKDGVIKDMEAKGIPTAKAKEYLETVRNIKPNETIEIILNYLKSYGFPDDWYAFDPTIARSFSYSDGPIWEVKIKDCGTSSVLGGERYDNLTKSISGVDVPGTGFGIGFDRTLEAAESLGLIPASVIQTKVLVTVFSEELLTDSLKVSNLLRSNGIATTMYTDPSVEIGKQMKYADRKNIPFVIVIGDDEKNSGVVQLKDMRNKTQEKLTVENAISKLRN